MADLTPEDWPFTTTNNNNNNNSSGEKRPKKGHRRSASLGQQDQLQLIRQRLQRTKEGNKQTESIKPRQSPVPAHHSALPTAQSPFTQPKSIAHNIPKPSMPRYQRNSVEGLNTEIEKLVLKSISLTEDEDKVHTHDIPDGHRAPLPEQQHHQQLRGNIVKGLNSTALFSSHMTSTRSLYTQTPSETVEISSGSSSNESQSCSSNSSSTAGSRSQSVSPVMPIMPAGQMETSRPSSQTDNANNIPKETDKGDPELSMIASPEPKFVSSPKPNMSYSFAREPPDGCERIRATCVESAKKTPAIKEPLLFCSPKNNAYVLKPSVTSAFNPLYKSLMSQPPELTLCSSSTAVVANTGQSQTSIEGQ